MNEASSNSLCEFYNTQAVIGELALHRSGAGDNKPGCSLKDQAEADEFIESLLDSPLLCTNGCF